MSDVRSRWCWLVFCAGLLTGMVLNQFTPVRKLEAGPLNNNGLPALRAEFDALKSQLKGIADLAVRDGENNIIGFQDPVLEGRVALTVNGQETALINDPNRAIIAILSCGTEGRPALDSGCGQTRLGETVFRDSTNAVNVHINDPFEGRGIIAILVPPNSPTDSPAAVEIDNGNSTALLFPDLLTLENLNGRTTVAPQGVIAQTASEEDSPVLRSVLEPQGFTLTEGTSYSASISPRSIELLVFGRPWLRGGIGQGGTGTFEVDSLATPQADIGTVVYDQLVPDQDYGGDPFVIPLE